MNIYKKKIKKNNKYSWTKYIFAASKESLLQILNNEKIPEEAREILRSIIETNEWIGQRIIQAIMRGDFAQYSGEKLIQKIKKRVKSLENIQQKQSIEQEQRQEELPIKLYTGIDKLDEWLIKVYEKKYQSLLEENLINLKDWYLYKIKSEPGFFIDNWQLINAINAAIAWHKKFQENISTMYAPIKQENIIMGPKWPGHEEWDGYTIQFIEEQRDFTAEGKNMGHCIASYYKHTLFGESFNFSIRTPQNKPIATFELDKEGEIVQEQGPNNTLINGIAANILEYFKKNVNRQILIQNIIKKWKKFSEVNESNIIQNKYYGKLLLIEKLSDIRAIIISGMLKKYDDYYKNSLAYQIYSMEND